MSKISSIYDELRSLIATTLPNHTELNNPYFLEDDADTMFDQGYAVGLGPAENTNRNICPRFSVQRDVIITITQRIFLTSRDITNRIVGEKVLLEAHKDVINAIESNVSSSNYAKLLYASDSGIEFLEGDRMGFLVLEILCNVEYQETVT